MINKIIIIICLALAAITANAQTITDELRHAKQGQGKVVINQSVEIERLVNNQPAQKTPEQSVKENGNRSNQTSGQPVTHQTLPTKESAATDHPSAEHSSSSEASASHSATPSSSQTTTEGEAAVVNTNKKIMRHSYKATGYRIQVYSGGNKREDRQKCEQISARLKASFPNLPIYVHFYSPSWKCRVGNFTDQGEAKSVLKQIRAMGYSQACLVKGTINVQY